jgi:hypothetical protein
VSSLLAAGNAYSLAKRLLQGTTTCAIQKSAGKGGIFLEWSYDMDIQTWYSRTVIDMIIGSKIVPVFYYSLVIRR